MTSPASNESSPYAGPLTHGIVLQVVILMLGGLVLDGGNILLACLYSAFPFWTGVLMIAFRRGSRITSTDILFLKYGIILTTVIGVPTIVNMWQRNGMI